LLLDSAPGPCYTIGTMKVGDLVRYVAKDGKAPSSPHEDENLGIITQTGVHRHGQPECHVVWYTCNNKGWWDSENLEVLSENR